MILSSWVRGCNKFSCTGYTVSPEYLSTDPTLHLVFLVPCLSVQTFLHLSCQILLLPIKQPLFSFTSLYCSIYEEN